ncbi:TPA: hypothetical protein ACV5QX_000846 [Pseudomonas aeruginosa]
MNKALDLLRGLVSEVERKTCGHEETHRGGAIWEICDSCGAKWADDEGGKPEFAWPESVEKARAFLATHPAVEQACWDERKLSDLGNELHNLSCSIVHENEKLAEQIGGIARELWNWPQARAALAPPSPAQAEAERPEVAEVAFVLRNIGAMDAEDINGDNVDLRFEDAEGRDTGCDVSIVEYAEKAADLFEQRDRIVGELRAERDGAIKLLGQSVWQKIQLLTQERDAANARLHEVATACATAEQERDAALARVAELEQKSAGSWTVDTSCGRPILMYEGCSVIEDQTAYEVIRMIKWIGELERQEPVATVAKVPGEDWNSLDFHRDLQDMQPGTKLYAAPVAQAQHSVPEEFIGRLSGFLAQRGTTGKALLRELRALCAAAPGKEVGHE